MPSWATQEYSSRGGGLLVCEAFPDPAPPRGALSVHRLVFRALEGSTRRRAIAFLDELLAKLPFRVEVIQTDNGEEFQSVVGRMQTWPMPRSSTVVEPACRREPLEWRPARSPPCASTSVCGPPRFHRFMPGPAG